MIDKFRIAIIRQSSIINNKLRLKGAYMNVTQKIQMMVMALKAYKQYERDFTFIAHRPFNIMITIMLSSNYPPFVKDVKPMLVERTGGYFLKSDDYYGQPGHHVEASDLIIKYAEQFINDHKK